MTKNYDHEDVYNRLDKIKDEEYVSEANAEILQEFIEYTSADPNISSNKQYEYLGTFNVLFKDFCDKDLDEASKKDIRSIVGKLNATDYADRTVRGYKVAIKKLYRTIYEDEFERPKRIKKILNANFMSTGKGKLEDKREKKALEPSEVKKLSNEANNFRDKLMPVFMFETGARISEIREGVQLKDIELNHKYAEVTIPTLKNDKGPRTLVLTKCVGLLQDWLERHPSGDDPEAYLFTNLEGSSGRDNQEMTYERMRQILKSLGENADIDKPVRPHIFRHSAATYYGMEWSVSRLKYWMGWKDTSMAETYCHENEQRMKKARLAEEGINTENNEEDELDRKECGRCGEKWPPTQKYCGKCSLSLDKEAAENVKTLEEAGRALAEEEISGSEEKLLDKAREVSGTIK